MICLFMFSMAGHADDNSKIGVIDFKQIQQDSILGKEIQQKIIHKVEALKSEIQTKQDTIKEMQENYKRESLLLSDEQKGRKENELRTAINEYRVLQNQSTQEYARIRAELTGDLSKTVSEIAEKIGKSKGYLLIIEKQSGSVVYAKESLDLTGLFVEEIDKIEKQDTAEKK